MKYIIFLMIIIVFSITSCENELDIEPRQSISEDVALSNPENIEALLIGAYDIARGNPLANDNITAGRSYNGDLVNIAILLGNSDQVEWNGTFDNLRDIYFKQMDNLNGSANFLWGDFYLLFGATNTVIENLDKFTDQDRKDRVEGEAKFLRGIGYFDMVRLFGQQYDVGSVNAQLGVPLVLSSPDVTRVVPRNTVEQVYDQVIQDLKDAYDKLPDDNGNRADKYAAQAVLARVYLQQGDFEKARDAAHDVIQNSGHSLVASYDAVFDTDDNTSETVFSWIVTNQEGSNQQVVHFATEALGGRGGDISIAQAYLDKFDSDLDERKGYTYEADGLVLSSKFVRQFANTQSIRFAEIHLIRAECNFRENTTIGLAPLDEINAIRARSSAPALGALTLDLILTERELELGLEGFALHDYKRTQRAIGGLPYNDDKLIFPIPQSARDRNGMLDQNPGY